MKAIIPALIILLASCTARTDDGCTIADLEAARAAGVRDAEAAAATDSLSYSRDSAIMDIRARETRMRDAGFGSAADAYVEAADTTLRSHGIID